MATESYMSGLVMHMHKGTSFAEEITQDRAVIFSNLISSLNVTQNIVSCWTPFQSFEIINKVPKCG